MANQFTFEIPGSVKPTTAFPTDYYYGPWTSTTQALSVTTGTRYIGQTVCVITSGIAQKYIFKSGTTDSDLVLENSNSINSNFLSLSGGTVSGNTNFIGSLSATTLYSGSTALETLFAKQTDLNGFIKRDGSSSATTNDIKFGNFYGIQWGNSFSTYLSGNDNSGSRNIKLNVTEGIYYSDITILNNNVYLESNRKSGFTVVENSSLAVTPSEVGFNWTSGNTFSSIVSTSEGVKIRTNINGSSSGYGIFRSDNIPELTNYIYQLPAKNGVLALLSDITGGTVGDYLSLSGGTMQSNIIFENDSTGIYFDDVDGGNGGLLIFDQIAKNLRLASFSGSILGSIDIMPEEIFLSVGSTNITIEDNSIESTVNLAGQRVSNYYNINGYGIRSSNVSNTNIAYLRTDLLTTNATFQFPNITGGTFGMESYKPAVDITLFDDLKDASGFVSIQLAIDKLARTIQGGIIPPTPVPQGLPYGLPFNF